MSNRHDRDENVNDELLAGGVLGDLDEDEMLELKQSLSNQKTVASLIQLEATAAAIQIALSDETLPDSLRDRILKNALRHVRSNSSEFSSTSRSEESEASSPSNLVQFQSSENAIPAGFRETQSRGVALREWIAWVACAAAVLLAVGLWQSDRGYERLQSVPYAQARDRLIAQATDVIQVEWTPGKTPFANPVRGDIVWSSDQQMGFMRFDGMPVNDADLEQYQLWIIDPARDDEPIDGGVFDISSVGEVTIPIDAKLGVIRPAAFAITIEKPGGVVVSTQERLPLLAAVH